LVPIGDRLLFSAYDYCLNIGGFANISYEQAGQRIAFDVVPANTVLNSLSLRAGKAFDENGEMAAAGKIISPLLEQLNQLAYYQGHGPKSLGREWLEQMFLPVLHHFNDQALNDLLRTITEHIAMQIAHSTTGQESGKTMLLTGGGALNCYLVSRIEALSNVDIALPSLLNIQYKEALIFALLGVLRVRGEHNCLASVTGASRDHCSGCIYPGLS
jgi:anhydro-N-acetylmuramic acid kinase